MRRRRSRGLTPEERKLWAEVARSVTPLRRPPPEPAPPPESGELVEAPVETLSIAPVVTPHTSPTLPPLVPLERKTVSALRRGRQTVEAVIDLHGMRQSEAHVALRGFLHRSQAAGLKVVLVITGKGAAAIHDGLGERGVLRRMVPHWLRLPDLRPLVVGFDEAARHHGGAGALYVRLRRSGRRELP